MNVDDHIWIQTPGMQWESLIIYLAVNVNQSNEKRKIKELQALLSVIDSERLAIEKKKIKLIIKMWPFD